MFSSFLANKNIFPLRLHIFTLNVRILQKKFSSQNFIFWVALVVYTVYTNCTWLSTQNSFLTLFRMDGRRGGGGQKDPPVTFFPVISTNVGISPNNFLTFSFNPFNALVLHFKVIPSASLKLLYLNQDHPSGRILTGLRL